MLNAARKKVSNLIKSAQERKCDAVMRAEHAGFNPGGIKHTFVLDKHNVVYNRVQKNGSTSIIVLLNAIASGAVEPARPSLKKIRRLRTLSKAELRALNTDTHRWLLVVRNPYPRVLSAFLNKFKSEKFRSAFGQFDLTPDGFQDFVRWLDEGNLYKNSHWSPQSSQMLLPIDRYTDIIRMENFREGIQKFLADIGSQIDESDLGTAFGFGERHTTRSDDKLNLFYDDRTKEIVSRLYENDFVSFGYGPNREAA